MVWQALLTIYPWDDTAQDIMRRPGYNYGKEIGEEDKRSSAFK